MSPLARAASGGSGGSRNGTRSSGFSWSILVASAVLEAVWALALDASNGFRLPLPTIVFAVANILSMIGLSIAMRGIPISVAYAVWTGIGAALTVTVAILRGFEDPSPLKILFLTGIIACVIGLRFAGGSSTPKAEN